MPQVTIHKCKDPETTPLTLLERMEAITKSIRERAFKLSQNRKAGTGSDLDDWVQAERDLVWSPASEMVEDDKAFRARVALPGFDAKDIEVSALPDALVIQADTTHTHNGEHGNVCFCEFSSNEVFRRIPLPTPIDVNKVTASVHEGVLEVTAPKAAPKLLAAHA